MRIGVGAPMRYLFIDRVLDIDAHGGGTITIRKAFPRSEEYFDGTFRRQDEVPASLLLETMATAGSSLLTARSRYQAHALLLKVNRATFRRPARAGDAVVVRARLAGLQGDWARPDAAADARPLAEVHTRAFVGEDPVAESALLFVGLPFAWTLGSRREETLAGMLELLGYTDRRP
jgi:3-hydroxymyristoyl/3-hydroxydecanoyl-(acyl carrier protein) dehydratase